MRICVDIDGVLTVETKGVPYSKRTPNEVNIAKVNQLFDSGFQIILYSARYESDREVTKQWLRRYGVKYSKLLLGKPKYDFIWDDKSLIEVESYNFKLNLCPRVREKRIQKDEAHPCFFCGTPIQISTVECPHCGIMICPHCGKCYCKASLAEKIILYEFHKNICGSIDKFLNNSSIELQVPSRMISFYEKLIKAFVYCRNIEVKRRRQKND